MQVSCREIHLSNMILKQMEPKSDSTRCVSLERNQSSVRQKPFRTNSPFRRYLEYVDKTPHMIVSYISFFIL